MFDSSTWGVPSSALSLAELLHSTLAEAPILVPDKSLYPPTVTTGWCVRDIPCAWKPPMSTVRPSRRVASRRAQLSALCTCEFRRADRVESIGFSNNLVGLQDRWPSG